MKKKEQFSIALWDRLKKDNIPHSFETREGNKVTQLMFFNCNDNQPILGVFHAELESWYDNGFYTEKGANGNDLFIVWEEEENENVFKAYMAIMKYDGLAMTFPTHEIAQIAVGNIAVAIIPVSIPYTKGEGLENGK